MMAQSLTSQITPPTPQVSLRIPIKPPPHSISLLPLLSPISTTRLSISSYKVSRKFRSNKGFGYKASSALVGGGGGSVENLERCLSISTTNSDSGLASSSSSSSSSSATVMFAPTMKERAPQLSSSGTVTLEKSKDMSLPKQMKGPETELGGGGGGIGKKINFGGGDGGDDGGDDDDYFGDFDEGDDGDEGGWFRKRLFLKELFDRKFVDAVLNEWQKTVLDLPAGLRQAYEMGLVSSAQMVKFLAINARPTTERLISRALPEGLSRAFIGRMIADPAFLYKFVLEQAATIGCSVWWEVKTRKERLKQEWDLALINVLTVSACNAVVVWSLAPSRSYGSTFRFDLQNTIQKLPNNVFEMNYPQRAFDMQKRVQSFFYKAAELCMVGLTAGAAQGALSNISASRKEGRLSVTIPPVRNNALGYGAFLALYANLRYQLLYGLDRAMMSRFDVIGVALGLSTALRIMNVQIGETSRLAWLGVEADPLAQSDDLLKKAYSSPTDASSNWFISKKAIVSGLGLLGLKKSNEEGAAPTARRRRRVVRKKLTAAA